jgi:acyl-CoA synthetase (AMP-forming)/AMP-acid ligase II
MDFGSIITNSAARYADNVAVWCDGRTQTHAELYERACRLANLLAELGLRKGDRVGMLSANAFETPEQIAGIALGGFVRSAVYAHETGEVNSYLLDLVDARALLVNAKLVEEIRPYFAKLPKLEHVLVFDGPAPEGTIDYAAALAGASTSSPDVVTAPDDVHVIRFSAGTTGRPKGIVHTVAQWMATDDEYRWVTPQLDERDAYLAVGQLTHAAALWFWPLLQVGGRIIVVPAFEPGRALELIEQQRATVTLVVPTMIQALLGHPDIDRRDLSSLRCLNYAASPISETTMTRALEKFGPVLYQLYAQSEAITITMLLPHQHRPDGTEEERRLMRSVGRPTPHTTISILDEDGRPLPTGEVGEIAVTARSRMKEIWKDPEATAARIRPDGALLTRDMGYLDEQGFLYLADRKEDLIISGGYNIWPAELENAIESIPGVREVCVIGVPHEKWGETPRAFVVLERGSTLTEEQIIAETRRLVGAVKKVTSVEFVDTLPKSGVGKILRRVIRDQFWKGATHRIAGA